MKASIIGWLILLACALTWEALGLAHVAGVWPLTWDVRAALDRNEAVAGLGVFLACVGFPAWLVWHFLIEKRRYPR